VASELLAIYSLLLLHVQQNNPFLYSFAFQSSIRHEDLRRGVSFPVGEAAWISLNLHSIACCRNGEMQISAQACFIFAVL